MMRTDVAPVAVGMLRAVAWLLAWTIALGLLPAWLARHSGPRIRWITLALSGSGQGFAGFLAALVILVPPTLSRGRVDCREFLRSRCCSASPPLLSSLP